MDKKKNQKTDLRLWPEIKGKKQHGYNSYFYNAVTPKWLCQLSFYIKYLVTSS